VVGSTLQIFAQIAGSLLKDDKTNLKQFKDFLIMVMFIFLVGWFIAGKFINKKTNINCNINIPS